MMQVAVVALLALAQTNDKAQANGYDDNWKSAWKTHLTTVIAGGPAKTGGFVLQVGDSITHANPYSQWPRYGSGKTAEDNAVCTWSLATTAFPGTNNDPNQTNGFYLAAADTNANRGMTASSGIAAFEFLSGSGNNTSGAGNDMPTTTVTATAKTDVSAASYDSNLQIDTVAAAFNAAQFAVLMLGTNDIGASRTTVQFTTDLGAIVDALESQHIGVILSTIPPRNGSDVTAYNTAIRSMAQSRSLPLIDFYAEILARQPGSSWLGTLIDGTDGIHPTATNSSGDPYTPGGDPTTHTTGDNCLTGGYLLRSWLTMQKLKEVKSFVIDGNPAVAANPGSGSSGSPSSSSTKSSSGGGHCGGSVAGPVSPAMLLGAALAALALLRAARKTGF